MVNKYLTRRIIPYSVLILMLSTIARADDPFALPTFSEDDYQYHYDPQTVDWNIPQGWAKPDGTRYTEGGKFSDTLDAPGTDWQWETEWYNPGPNVLTLPIIFMAEGFGDDRFPTERTISLPPGGREVVQLELSESGQYPEYETGEEFEYLMWVDPNPGGPAFRHDCSFCERTGPLIGAQQQDAPAPEWVPRPLQENGTTPYIYVLVRPIPPRSRQIPALSQWGSIGMALILLATGALVIYWRRRQVAT